MSRDAGEIVLMALAEALVPFNVTDQANTTEALLRDLTECKIGTAAKRRGTKAERQARIIGRHFVKIVDASTARDIAEAATGASITDRSLRPGR